MTRGGIGCCRYVVLECTPMEVVSYCPFCLWSVTYQGSTNPGDLEELFAEHLAEHVEEMVDRD